MPYLETLENLIVQGFLVLPFALVPPFDQLDLLVQVCHQFLAVLRVLVHLGLLEVQMLHLHLGHLFLRALPLIQAHPSVPVALMVLMALLVLKVRVHQMDQENQVHPSVQMAQWVLEDLALRVHQGCLEYLVHHEVLIPLFVLMVQLVQMVLDSH